MIQSKRFSSFSHLDTDGKVQMVDVSQKVQTERLAKASAWIRLLPSTMRAIKSNSISKGDIFSAAKIAGILAAKKVSELIPLAHPIGITHCDLSFQILSGKDSGIKIFSTVKKKSETGVEMEALTAVSIAALTLYDMVKAVDRAAVIARIQLEEKSGGKSGHYKRN